MDGIVPEVQVILQEGQFVDPDRLMSVLLVFTEPVFNLTTDEIAVTNGTAHDIAPTYPTDEHPRFSRWDLVVEPHGEGPITVQAPQGVATDAFGNGNDPSRTVTKIAATPVDVEVALSTSGFAEGGAAEFVLSRSRDNGEIAVSISVDDSGDFASGTVEIARASDPDNPLEATFQETPAAIEVTFEAGELSKRIKALTDDDRLDEPDGSITVRVVDDSGQYKYVPGWSRSATSVVRDNDEPVSVSIGWVPNLFVGDVLEGLSTLFVLDRTSDSGEMTVLGNITQVGEFLDTSRSYGLEYLEDGQFRVVFSPGRLSKFVRVYTLDNTTHEDSGSITFNLLEQPEAGYQLISDRRRVVIPVLDNDDPPTVTIAADEDSVIEGDQAVYTLTRSNGPLESRGNPITVALQVSQQGSFLAESGDLGPDTPGPVTVQATFPASTYTTKLRLDTLDNDVSGRPGDISVTVAPAPRGAYLVGDPATATLTVRDDELPVITVHPVGAEVTEGEDVVFRFTRVGGNDGAVNVGVYVTGHQKIMTPETEAIVLNSERPLQLVDTHVAFGEGETEATLTLTTQQDNTNEGDGRLGVHLAQRGAPRYVLGVPSRAEVLVKDDDIPTVSILMPELPTGTTLSESGDTWEGTINEGEVIRFGMECTGEYAFSEHPNGLYLYTLRVFEMNHPGQYTPYKFETGWAGYNRMFITPSFYNCGAGQTTSHNGYRMYTGPDNGEVRMSLLESDDLSPDILRVESERYRQAHAEAARLGTLAPLLEPGLFNTHPAPDSYGCQDELRFCPRHEIGAPNKIKLKVLNRDPTILIKAESDEVNEGQPARFILERRWNEENLGDTSPGWADTRVFLRTSVEGEYVTSMLPTEITFGLNETRKVIELPTVADSAFAPDGSVSIEILVDTTGSDENLAAKYSTYETFLGHTDPGSGKRADLATVTIVNDDRQPGILISDARLSESGGSMVFDVTLTNVWVPEVTVNWATSDGTATAGTDYTASSGTISFPDGDTSLTRTITVPISEDTEFEGDETFTIVLSEPAGAGFQGGGETLAATGTIEDNDLPVVTVEAKTAEVSEGDSAVFVLTRTGNTRDPLTIRFQYLGGGTNTTRAAYFAEYETIAEVFLDTWEDGVVNYPPVRDFTVELFGDGEYGSGTDEVWTAGDPATATVTATDNDELILISVEAEAQAVEAVDIDEGNIYVAYLPFVFRRTGDVSAFFLFRVTAYFNSLEDNENFIELGGADSSTYNFIFEAGQSELRILHDVPVNTDINNPHRVHERGVTYLLFGDGGYRGFHRVWKAGVPSSATIYAYAPTVARTIVLTGEAPTLAQVGDEVTVDFRVTNIGNVDTGTNIVVETNRDDVTCRISAAIAPGGTAECQATITVTVADLALIGSDIVLVATAKDGDNHSNALLLEIQAHGTVTVGFEETQVTVTEGPDAEAVLKVNIAGGRQGNIDVAYELSPKIDKPAIPGEDYDGSSGTLTFGTDDREKTISIPIYQDEIDEAREKFTVTLTASGGAVVDPDRATAVVTIMDEHRGNDDPYVPRASVYFNHDGPVPESAGSAEFVVRLDRPSGKAVNVDRNLTFQGTATIGTDYVGPTVRSLFIPPGETEATFSVVIFDDEENEDDETFEVRITRGQYGLIDSSANTATGTIADDDDVLSTAIILSVSRDTVQEGEEITVTVTARLDPLDADPLDTDITVRVSVDDDSREANAADASDFDASAPFEIVISAGQTSGSQTFQLNAGDDDLDETDETIVLQGDIADENEADALPVTPVTLTITDDDTRGITVNPVIISLEEDGEGSFYRIKLDSMPTDTVTIRVEPGEGGHLSVNPSEMTFTQENWNRGRRVNVLAMEDGDTQNNSPTYIGHSVSGGDYGDVTAADVSVLVTDMTVPEISVSPARGSEGSGELEFRVTVNPSISRIVDVQYELIDETAEAGSDYTKPEGGAQTLRFLAGQTRKTIRVPVTDDGVDEEDEETFFLRLTDISDHANLSGGTSTLEVQGTIEDNDATPVASVNGPGGTISFVPESVGTVTFTITLEGSASEVVSVDYSTGNLSGAISGRAGGIVNAVEDEDYTGVEGTVEFQPGETTKTVTVNVTNDNVSEALEYFGFHISNPRNAYLKQTGASTAILDNDPKRVVVTPTSLTLAEGGAAGSYTVRLATELTENVTVTIGGYAGTDVSVDETSLTFTPEDWETAQPVEVTAREDDDAVNDTVTLTHTPAGGDYEGLDADGVTVTVTDNDTAGLVLSETALTITEGDSAEYTVKLASEPADTVQLSFGIPAGSELTTEPRSLTFTVGNWNDERRVEVTSHPDDDAVHDVAAITHMPVGGDYGPAHNADLTITVTDQDTPGLTISPATLTVDEGGTADYTVRLDTEPTGEVTVTIAGEGDVSVEPDTLTFTVSDWNYGKTVTASANPDDDVTNDSATLSHTASGGDYGTVSEDLPVTVTDNSAEIVLSESAITVDEEGEDVSYTVKLAAEPTGPVIVTITGASETILSLEDDSLTFTVDDWNSEQEVIVSADHDDDGSADEFTLTHTAGGGGYDAAPDAELQVTANDNDTADVIISETALTIDEGGDGTYTVKLKTEPTGEVTVTVNDPSNTDVTAEPSSLTFTTETWNNAQPVTVSAKEDDDDTADEAATVTHTVSGADYEDVTAADVEVTVIDNDDPQVTVSFGASSLHRRGGRHGGGNDHPERRP